MPKLCRTIEEELHYSNDESESPFMTSEEFHEWAEEVLRFDESDDDDTETDFALTQEESELSIEYLDSSGIVSTELRV